MLEVFGKSVLCRARRIKAENDIDFVRFAQLQNCAIIAAIPYIVVGKVDL